MKLPQNSEEFTMPMGHHGNIAEKYHQTRLFPGRNLGTGRKTPGLRR